MCMRKILMLIYITSVRVKIQLRDRVHTIGSTVIVPIDDYRWYKLLNKLLKVCIDKEWKELYKIAGPFQDCGNPDITSVRVKIQLNL